jgi:hypothetical protein|nr:MAG TPA: hypothetical protein [Caudoviricetes sp.]
MLEEEKIIIEKLYEKIKSLGKEDKRYLLGVADGMAMAYKEKRAEPAEEKDIA